MTDIPPKTIPEQILERIKALESMLHILLLERKLEDLEKKVQDFGAPPKKQSLIQKFNQKTVKEEEPKANLSEALDNLEEFTTVKKDANGKRTFLLHRPTPDFEYQKFADKNEYETTKETDWIGEIEAAEFDQKDKNPVVSCWIEESSIGRIQGAEANTGTWGELGANPHATKYKIWIKPGKYQIYKELKQ